uniref:Uncharacterized protein n=1 Tax=Romanomermis culicivorax TaxID=13658 RepID=A0A915HEZ8_ROMCU
LLGLVLPTWTLRSGGTAPGSRSVGRILHIEASSILSKAPNMMPHIKRNLDHITSSTILSTGPEM